MQTLERRELTTYSEEEVAAMLGIKIATLQKWRWIGHGPAYVKIGRRARYRGADIAAYLEKHKHGGGE